MRYPPGGEHAGVRRGDVRRALRPPLPTGLSRWALHPLRPAARNSPNNPDGTRIRVPCSCPVRVHLNETTPARALVDHAVAKEVQVERPAPTPVREPGRAWPATDEAGRLPPRTARGGERPMAAERPTRRGTGKSGPGGEESSCAPSRDCRQEAPGRRFLSPLSPAAGFGHARASRTLDRTRLAVKPSNAESYHRCFCEQAPELVQEAAFRSEFLQRP